MHLPSFLHHPRDGDPSQTSGWASFIGIVICLCGNVIISFALNIQRLAHERIQTRVALNTRERRQSQSSDTTRNYGTTPHKPDDVEDQGEGTRYLKSKLWWTGLILMAIGETGNFVACTIPFLGAV